jgi:hypothetical protein
VTNVPEWGFETDEGISLDFAWPKQRIAVLFEPDEDDAAELEDNGWTLVSASVDTVTSMLVERGVESSSASTSDSRSEDRDGDGEGADR